MLQNCDQLALILFKLEIMQQDLYTIVSIVNYIFQILELFLEGLNFQKSKHWGRMSNFEPTKWILGKMIVIFLLWPMLLELLYSKIGCETSLNCLLLTPFYVKHVPNNSFNRSHKDINLSPIDTLVLPEYIIFQKA